MQWNHEKTSADAYDNYVKTMTRSLLMSDCVPLAKKIAAYWHELTGHVVSFNWYLGHFYLYLDMGQELPDGTYPTKAKHLALFMEFMEDTLYWRIDRKKGRKDSVDKFDHNFSYEGWGTFPSWAVHASHGGNCRLVKTNVRTQEVYDYETVCDD